MQGHQIQALTASSICSLPFPPLKVAEPASRSSSRLGKMNHFVFRVSARVRRQFADKTGYKIAPPREAARSTPIEFLLFAAWKNGVHGGARQAYRPTPKFKGGILPFKCTWPLFSSPVPRLGLEHCPCVVLKK